MQTPEEIKNSLQRCATCSCATVGDDYFSIRICSNDLKDALAYINELEERIDLMLIQMRGDCGVCKHKYAEGEPCCSCITNDKRPAWEYEGLPELPRKEKPNE